MECRQGSLSFWKGIAKSWKIVAALCNLTTTKLCATLCHPNLMNEKISQEERREVEECVKVLKKELLKNTGWYDRWVMKYIERLY